MNDYEIEGLHIRVKWLQDSASIVVAIILIALGSLFLLDQWLHIDLARYLWPFFVIVPGVLLFLSAISQQGAEGEGLAIVGSLVTMVGLVLLVQSITGLWATWTYAWALVAPASVGLGMLGYGWIKGRTSMITVGSGLVKIGVGLFIAFGAFFELLFNISGIGLGRWLLPLALIGLGVHTLSKAIRPK